LIKSFYDKIFVLQKPTETYGDFGQLTKSFATLTAFVGYLENQTGNRNFYGNSYETYAELILFCDILTDIDTSYRILYDNKYYRIVNIFNIRNHHMELDLVMIEGDSK
jgi:head-tail adaptor